MEVFLAVGPRAIHDPGYWNHAKECKFRKKTYSSYRFPGPRKNSFQGMCISWFFFSCKFINRNNKWRTPKDVHTLLPGTCKFVIFTDTTKGMDLRWEMITNYLSNVVSLVLKKPFPATVSEKKMWQWKECQRDVTLQTWETEEGAHETRNAGSL